MGLLWWYRDEFRADGISPVAESAQFCSTTTDDKENPLTTFSQVQPNGQECLLAVDTRNNEKPHFVLVPVSAS